MSSIDLNIDEQWYDAILGKGNGIKTIEGRVNKDKYKDILSGKIKFVHFVNEKRDSAGIYVLVDKVVIYKNFEEYIIQEGISRTLPGVKTIKDALNIYYNYYPESDEKEYGVLAIHFSVMAFRN